MKSNSNIFLILGLLFSLTLSAQQPAARVDSAATALDSKIEVYQKENIPFKKPVPYAPTREADIMLEWIVWREVDLRQLQNFPLYYPTNPKMIGSRVNFFTLLLQGIERGEITPYNPFPSSDEFAEPITWEQLQSSPGLRESDRTETSVSIYTGNDTTLFVKGKNLLEEENIQRIMIKEKIYFDKKHSVLNFRVIGFRPDFMILREGATEATRIPVCWIYMDEARPLLARHPVFNPNNLAQNVSYDDFFMQNRYNGRIVRQANLYNNRSIAEYASGLDALYESRRIEQEIFDSEQDLWEY
jgi:gliding motility associated protien GldN